MDCRPFKWSNYEINPRYSYMVDLSKGIDWVWKNMNKDRRNDINRAKREGISIEEGSKKDMFELHDLLVRRYAEQGKMVSVSKGYSQGILSKKSKNSCC